MRNATPSQGMRKIGRFDGKPPDMIDVEDVPRAGRGRQPAVGIVGVGVSFATALAARARRIAMNAGLPV